MELKTKIHAKPNQPDLLIEREFDLPVALLFKAYTDAEIVAQWMNTNVVLLDAIAPGAWRFKTSDANGNIVFSAGGTIHTILPEKRIVRTFEMDNAGFDVQLEFLDFEAITATTSKLIIQSMYRSAAMRDKMLKLPFAQGLNMAHNRLQNLFNN